MGNGASREEQLYQAVQNGNTNAVKALHHEGVALEFVDKEGRTPLMLACSRGDLFEMVLTLLNIGANVNAYQPGSHGGQPLHQAAKFGLDRTVFLLLNRGADPLAVNDDVVTPLDLARNHGHLNVVRMIEDRIAIFSGMLRELSGFGFLETFVRPWVTRKIWAVVIPRESESRRPVKCELVIYISPKHPLPRTLIPLVRAEVEEPKFNVPDPVLVLTDKKTNTKYKFLAEAPGDKAQIERFYRACKGVEQAPAGMPSPTALQGMAALVRPAAQTPPTPSALSGPSAGKLKNSSEGPRDEALRMGVGTSAEDGSYPKVDTENLGGWGDDDKASSSDFNGWGSSTAEAGPSSVPGKAPVAERENVPEFAKTQLPTYDQITETATTSSTPLAPPTPPSALAPPTPPSALAPPTPPSALAPSTPPSAPPIPLDQDGGPIFYPPIDTSPIVIDEVPPPTSSSSAPTPNAAATEERGGQCVVCWDAKAEAVCIPCGHLAGCMDCLAEIKAKDWGCPVCRAPIQQVVKVYAV